MNSQAQSEADSLKPVLVVITAAYQPGFKGGGPIRSLVNLVNALGSALRIRVITRDRDVGDETPYAGIVRRLWLRRGRSAVFYASGGCSILSAIRSALRVEGPTILYLNSFFEPRFSILPLTLVLIGMLRPSVVVLAPRGEFSPGALGIRSIRKRVFLFLARVAGIHDRVKWHATTEAEADDVRRAIGCRANILIARNITDLTPREGLFAGVHEQRRPLVVTFLSRISEKKNLAFAIGVLQSVSVPVEFRIAGPLEDGNYWSLCQAELAKLPPNVRVVMVGPVNHRDVIGELARAHLFFLPTRGENYGHVIAESLMAGVPVLISDRTPWRHLAEKNIGWDLGLDDPTSFVQAIEDCAALSDVAYLGMRHAARRYAEELLGAGVWYESMEMFSSCLTERENERRRDAT